MRGINQITVVGRLGQDPELLTSKSGDPWMRISVATNRGVKKEDEWVEETDWHRVHLFGRKAERCMEMARAGTLVGVTGTMTYDRWTDEEGVRRVSARILADQIHFLRDLREKAEA